MTKVLVTGMSGADKSTALQMLSERGHRVVDTDTDEWSHWIRLPDGSTDWMARECRRSPAGQSRARSPLCGRLQDQPRKVLPTVRPRSPLECTCRRPPGQSQGTKQQPVWETSRRTSSNPAVSRRGGTATTRERNHPDRGLGTNSQGSPTARKSCLTEIKFLSAALPNGGNAQSAPQYVRVPYFIQRVTAHREYADALRRSDCAPHAGAIPRQDLRDRYPPSPSAWPARLR